MALRALVVLALAQSPEESAAAVRRAVDLRFEAMPAAWREAKARAWTARLADPSVSPATRSAVLQGLEAAAERTTRIYASGLRLAARLPEAAPPPERLVEGAEQSAALFDASLRNALAYPPLTPEGRAAAERQVEYFRAAARRLVDERVVGDAHARARVGAEIDGLFDRYRGLIGDPWNPFLNVPPDPERVKAVADGLSAAIPADRRFVLSGLTGRPEDDEARLLESGVSQAVYDVVVLGIYLPLSNASWADRKAFEEVADLEERLLEWKSRLARDMVASAGGPLPDDLDEAAPPPLPPTRQRGDRTAVRTADAPPDPGRDPVPAGDARRPVPWLVLGLGVAGALVLLVLLRSRRPA